MKIFEYLDRITRVHKLLKLGETGTPEELADQLGVSRTSMYELLDELRFHGAPIKYSKIAKTYYYKEPFEITVFCSLYPLNNEEIKNYSGGYFKSKILFFRTMLSEISTVTLQC